MIFKRPPTPAPGRWEFLTNLSDPIQIDGHVLSKKTAGCRLSSAPKKETNNNMTDSKIAAIKAETQELKSQLRSAAIDYAKAGKAAADAKATYHHNQEVKDLDALLAKSKTRFL
ncbi:MAG: hypothetical protein PHV39_06190 [Methanomicrobium sp.]|nr:hypothetical protein [Methanomicrobium sp.]